MNRPTMLVVLSLGAILAAAPAPAQTGPAGEVPVKAQKSLCPQVTVSSVDKPDVMGKNFSAARSADLIFHVLFDGSLDGEHVVTLKVFTPNGHLYRRFDVPTAAGTEGPSHGARRLSHYPYPVPVHAPRPIKVGGTTYESVDVPFPVAGSAIVTSSLYGRWNVEVSLDGAADPCGKPAFFFLRD